MPPGAVRETSDFLAPEVRARLAAQQSTPVSPTLGSDAWTEAAWANRNQPMGASSMAPAEPQRGFEPWLNPQPPQSPASGRDAWKQAGRPGWDPNGTYSTVTGTAKDGTEFGLRAEADAYDRWRGGSQGNAQPNPTQPPPYGRYGGPQVDPWVGATPQNPAYSPSRGNVRELPMELPDPGREQRYTEFVKQKGLRPGIDRMDISRLEEFNKLEAQRPENMQRMEEGRQRHEATRRAQEEQMKEWGQPRFDTTGGVPLTAEQRRARDTVYLSGNGPRTQGVDPEYTQLITKKQMDPDRWSYYPNLIAQENPAQLRYPAGFGPASNRFEPSTPLQQSQNSYGFRGYDIDNGYSIKPPDSPANAANFGGGPKPNLFSQSFTSPDGTTSDQPNFNQRDAFLNNLLDHDSDNPGGRYQGRGRAPQSFMEPRPDIMGMWNKAGSMARDGWTNPVAGLLNQAR